MKIKRTANQLKKTIPPFKGEVMTLNNKKLHKDLMIKLRDLKKPQAYLSERLGVSRATFWRISQGKEITLSTFFRLVGWLDEDLNSYTIKAKPAP